jgi:hypothetical protein
LREIDKSVPADLDIHCIVDNYGTHSHPKIRAWLANRPRWRMHFIPTYSSWLNPVERFFALITDKAIRRDSFTSVKQLVQRIDHFVDSYNEKCEPFRWVATADSIVENSIDFAHVLPGQDTSQGGHNRSSSHFDLQPRGAPQRSSRCHRNGWLPNPKRTFPLLRFLPRT